MCGKVSKILRYDRNSPIKQACYNRYQNSRSKISGQSNRSFQRSLCCLRLDTTTCTFLLLPVSGLHRQIHLCCFLSAYALCVYMHLSAIFPRFLHNRLVYVPICSLQCLHEAKAHMHVKFKSCVLPPNGTAEATILFHPDAARKYREQVIFEVNGLSPSVVEVQGEGIEMKVRPYFLTLAMEQVNLHGMALLICLTLANGTGQSVCYDLIF